MKRFYLRASIILRAIPIIIYYSIRLTFKVGLRRALLILLSRNPQPAPKYVVADNEVFLRTGARVGGMRRPKKQTKRQRK